MNTDKHLTAAEAAEHYGVSLRTIRRWIAAGRIETVRPTPGRAIRVIVNRAA